MSVHVIYYQNGVKMMRPVVSGEQYRLLRGSARQRAVVKAVREGDEAQKQRLLQMNYSCLPNEDGSLKGATRLSNSVGMDAGAERTGCGLPLGVPPQSGVVAGGEPAMGE